MSSARKPTSQLPPAAQSLDTERANAALRASGIDYQIEGEVDAKAFTRAFVKRFPKTMAKLAE